uniref:Putative peroxisome microbody protein 175.1 n=1 Tax=Homo sapiens TaxID=9606 RepID=V9H0D9_HUMAN|nr:putative peroxisome microbody protein 175.1 [Homo sapiens]
MVTDNTHLTLYSLRPMQSPEQAQLPFPSSLTSCLPPSCPSCHPWWPGRPGSPQRFKWLHCWDPHLGGSPGHSEGTQDPASRRNHPPPWLAGKCPWLSWHQCLLIPPGQTLLLQGHLHDISNPLFLRSGSPVWPNSCWLMVIFSRTSSEPSVPVVAILASAAEAAAARLGSSSCRCCCSSIETRGPRPAEDQHWDLLQIQSHWHRDPAWHPLPQPKSEN